MRRGQQVDSLPGVRPTLRVRFETLEEFRGEYQTNLVKGGLFLATRESLELRQEVDVELELAFASTSLRFPGEVVSVVGAELARAGGTPGVAVQLLVSPTALRAKLEPIAGQSPGPAGGQQPGERRRAPRAEARVVGNLSSSDASLAVRTRDLSHSGVLVSMDGVPLVPVGELVQLKLVHPITGQELEVEGSVVRHVDSKGGVPSLAVAFTEREAARPDVMLFVDDLHSLGHARKLAGISGPLEEVGFPGLLQSFANASPKGTLAVEHDREEGRVAFEGGLLVGARAGRVAGGKALARMLGWETGSFTFHAEVDDVDRVGDAMPLEPLLIDAARQFDEAKRLDPLPMSLDDDLHATGGARDGEPLSKTEEAVLDLAVAGFSVRGAIDVIPEEDHTILRALLGLIERGLVSAGS